MYLRIFSLAAVLLLAACSLPRGAAIESEILSEAAKDAPTFSVVHVTRATLPDISNWPPTGWHRQHQWPAFLSNADAFEIRAGDSIDLLIWDSQENSLLVTAGQNSGQMPGLNVSPTGTVFVPYVGNVSVQGMSPEKGREHLQAEIAKIAPDAQVQMSVTAGRGNSVDLVGGVGAPNNYLLPDRAFTLLSLLAKGGGISRAVRNPLIRLIRGGRTFEIRADVLFSNAAKDVPLRGGDKIIVEADNRYFTTLGATGSEELVYFDREHITALEALSLVGGLTDTRANPQSVLVLREYPAAALADDPVLGPKMRQVVFTLDLTNADGLFAARKFVINPKDTVLATESPVNAVKTVVGLVGSLFSLRNQL